MMKKIEIGMLVLVMSLICGIASGGELKAVRASTPIKIDGKLDEAAWKVAPVCGPLIHLKKSDKNKPIPKNLQTTFKMLFDDNGVYFGIRANETNTAKIKKAVKKEIDSSLWQGDDVEVFIDTNRDRTEYYQFATSPGGAKSDLYFIEAGNTGSAGYNPEWNAEGFIGKNFYSVEMFIPYAAFYKQRLKSGPQNWLISVCRQRLAGKKFRHTRLTNSSKGGFHDVKTMVPIGKIVVPKSIANIGVSEFSVATEKQEGKLQCNATMNARLLDKGSKNAIATLSTKNGEVSKKVSISSTQTSISLPPVPVATEGKTIFNLKISDASTKRLLYTNKFVRNVEYLPMRLTMIAPAYRNNIYATENIDAVKADLELNLPAKIYAGGTVSLDFQKNDGTVVSQRTIPATKRLKIELPAKGIADGKYALKIALKSSKGKQLAALNVPIGKIGRAPAVELRINTKNNLLINGVPLMIRGWYGGTTYVVPRASFAACRAPRSMNFYLGMSKSEALNFGNYYMVGLSRVEGLEQTCKEDKKLSPEIKKAVKAIVEKTKYDRNAIGYYLSDEPECRGLSEVTLKELYDYVKELDPYRLCLIVSRAPATYAHSCDVICPHPYNNPIMTPEGKRSFSSDYGDIHRKMIEGYNAIKGKAKALWIMPQIFSYYNYGANPIAVQPDFDQARWSIMSGMANHASGMVPFIFCAYVNDIENRISCNYIFETLAWLGDAWSSGEDIEMKVTTPKDAPVDITSKLWKRKNRRDEICMVAANRSPGTTTATFKNKKLKKYKRVFVLRENRSIPIATDGSFKDTFDNNGAHVYTTCEIFPDFKTLTEIKKEISDFKAPNGNLLNNRKLNWCRGVEGRNCAVYGDSLADNCLDAGGWYPWYGNRKELLLAFPDGVKFKKFSFYSNNIADAELQVWSYGKWIKVTEWKNRTKFKSTWKGEEQDTVKLRIIVKKMRYGRSSSENVPNITEIDIRK